MTVAYLPRLVCLSLACYFLVHTVSAAGVWALAGRAIRLAGRLRPRDAARLLLGLRLLPPAAAAFAVAGWCVPSFLWLEPEAASEEAGWACLAAAALGAALWALALGRASKAMAQSSRDARLCRRFGREERSAEDGVTVWVLDAPAPVLALAGILRPRVVMTRGLREALDPEQLAVALRHEQAHRRSHDNLKRLALLLAPDLLPGCRAFAALERAWARFAEWDADDRAVGGDARRPLLLADALVRVARLHPVSAAAPLAAPLVGNAADLEARVTRLLESAPGMASHPHAWSPALAAAAMAAAGLAAILLRPETLYAVHRLLEGLMR